MYKMNLSNVIKHFKLITIHRWYVFRNCWKAGIPLRGLIHDLSKYSPTEFCESVKYYQGNRSPIDDCKEANGYSRAWLHHKGRNTHHYEYWQDNFDKGGEALMMPYPDALEMVCDYLAAGKAYMKKNFTYKAEYEWWQKKIEKPIAMHSNTKNYVDMMLKTMAKEENNDVLKPYRSYDIYYMTCGLLL